jgi:hypothetical protein
MTVVNPFAEEVQRGAAWERGYEAGYAEPGTDHYAPFDDELVEIFGQGEQAGRDDRRAEPTTQTPIPSSQTDDFFRFESAPDGTLIAIPDEAPEGHPIREDAQITVRAMPAGYYVSILNGPTGANTLGHLAGGLVTETAIANLEHMLAHAVRTGARRLVRFAGLSVRVAVSVFTPSPMLTEHHFRGYLTDGTSVSYVVLEPQQSRPQAEELGTRPRLA